MSYDCIVGMPSGMFAEIVVSFSKLVTAFLFDRRQYTCGSRKGRAAKGNAENKTCCSVETIQTRKKKIDIQMAPKATKYFHNRLSSIPTVRMLAATDKMICVFAKHKFGFPLACPLGCFSAMSAFFNLSQNTQLRDDPGVTAATNSAEGEYILRN